MGALLRKANEQVEERWEDQMKKLVVVLLAGVMSYSVEAVSYSVPVLTVRSDGRGIVRESGTLSRCPFSFEETTNLTPVRVSIIEDVPVGTGNAMRSSVWLAVTTAALSLNRDLSGETIHFETSGYVDGPSAGGVLCLAVMSAIDGRTFPDDFAMTGTIMADGTIGAVGGVAEKIRGASRTGIKRICIPSSMRLDGDDNYTDLLELGKSLNIEIYQVTTILEAYRILHRLPEHQITGVNPVEICRLPTHVETVLKDRYVLLAKDAPEDESMINDNVRRSAGEFVSGLFGVAAMDLVNGLNELVAKSHSVEVPSTQRYPFLAHELPTNENLNVSSKANGSSLRQDFLKNLKALHCDLKEISKRTDDEEAKSEDATGEARHQSDDSEKDRMGDWFNDYVKSPSEAQCIGISNNYIAFSRVIVTQCDDITSRIDSMGDWDALKPEELNKIRSLLISKLNLMLINGLFQEGGENYERLDSLYRSLLGSIPYIRPNGNIRQVENLFYRTMKSMSVSFEEMGFKNEGYEVLRYRTILNMAEGLHSQAEKSEDVLPDAVFTEVQVISAACSLLMRLDPTVTDNPTYFSSAVTTARENALLRIAECRKLDIPCVMPVLCFQLSESKRDARLPGGDADQDRFDVLESYLAASIGAKALILCFDGQKPELNSKGYCSKVETVNDFDSGLTCFTVRYLGVDSEPVLRDGFSGWRVSQQDGVEYTSWLDLKGRDVRYKTTNECWTSAYDDAGRLVRKTYCNDSWVPTPRKDGVLFETKGYDADGNETAREFFGASSNHVNCSDGVAIIRSMFNKRGKETQRRFHNPSGEPVAHKDGYAGYDIDYDKRGNPLTITYIDHAGKPGMTAYGYARTECKYNAQGLETERAWYDGRGGLVCIDGVAKVQNEYDENGNLTKRMNFGADNRLTRDSFNVAITCWTYDKIGQVVECRYYGPDSLPTQHRAGDALWKNEFDSTGRIVGRRHFDLNGNEVDIKE